MDVGADDWTGPVRTDLIAETTAEAEALASVCFVAVFSFGDVGLTTTSAITGDGIANCDDIFPSGLAILAVAPVIASDFPVGSTEGTASSAEPAVDVGFDATARALPAGLSTEGLSVGSREDLTLDGLIFGPLKPSVTSSTFGVGTSARATASPIGLSVR